ncbi:acyltransferase [Luminiphilus sp.]|nr:acyltransferase [Luminiphilus sp.]
MLLKDIYKKILFHKKANRIGPDMPFSHWKLHFRSTMLKLCRAQFLNFGEGAEFRAGAYAVCCSNISLGKNVIVRPSTMMFADEFAQIVIEDNVMMGAGVHFYVNNHRFDRHDIPLIQQGYYPSENIVIKEGAWLGANSIVLPGVTVGRNSVVGAGSVVTKDVPSFCIYAGTPAKLIKKTGK